MRCSLLFLLPVLALAGCHLALPLGGDPENDARQPPDVASRDAVSFTDTRQAIDVSAHHPETGLPDVASLPDAAPLPDVALPPDTAPPPDTTLQPDVWTPKPDQGGGATCTQVSDWYPCTGYPDKCTIGCEGRQILCTVASGGCTCTLPGGATTSCGGYVTGAGPCDPCFTAVTAQGCCTN